VLIATGLTVTAAAKARQFELLHPHSETKVDPIERFVAAETFNVGSRRVA
jgi:hypothetical protein